MRIHTKFGDVLHLHIKIRTITVDFTLIIHKTLGKRSEKKDHSIKILGGNAKSFFWLFTLRHRGGKITNLDRIREKGGRRK